MRFFRRGSAAIAVLSALALLAVGSPTRAATPGIRFEDPVGDSIDTRASMDIVAVSVGIKPMAPRNTPSLVVTWELSAPPESTGAAYEFYGETEACGSFHAAYRAGTAYNIVFGEVAGLGISTHQVSVDCGSPPDETGSTTTFVQLMTAVKDNTVTMWTPISGLPKQFPRSGQMTDLRAFSQFADPVTGILGNGALGLEANDEATTEKVWSY
ncbi:MAG TPA: hypothetical protein VMY88_07445 [Acidimicrobiales bacterium]|nr:hypothetical protein [Acidimicrobiales bacterium]